MKNLIICLCCFQGSSASLVLFKSGYNRNGGRFYYYVQGFLCYLNRRSNKKKELCVTLNNDFKVFIKKRSNSNYREFPFVGKTLTFTVSIYFIIIIIIISSFLFLFLRKYKKKMESDLLMAKEF